MKILMVCLGNICRSPLAEGIMREKVKKYGLKWEVDSAGTGAWHVGEKPDSRSVRIAGKNGIDISSQRARQFHHNDFQLFDLILVMDSSNYQDIAMQAKHQNADLKKVELIMNFVQPGFNQNVPDPYWDDDGFERVFSMLEMACEKLIERYKPADFKSPVLMEQRDE